MDDWIIQTKVDKDFANKVKKEINEIIVEKNLVSNLAGRSTTGKDSKQYNLQEVSQEIKCINTLKNIILNTLRDQSHISLKDNLKLSSCWSVKGSIGTFHQTHCHNNFLTRHYSTVLYLETDKDEIFGNFYALLKDNEYIRKFEHNPSTGDLLIFPVWIWHGTYPQRHLKRQTLNIDFYVQ